VNEREAVRDFYERIPYPPPLTSLHEDRNLYGNPARRRALFHRMWPAEKLRPNQEILIAGCGTSQAASHALREPDARVTAIDISATSLDHTRDLQRKYNLQNLELHQLPIERVGELARAFDQIVCTGVLHHLPDPDAGLRALRDALEPQGAIHVMVYAPYGRAGIYMMQAYCRELGVSASEKELQDLGVVLGALTADHPIAPVLRRAADFRKPDALADALLHPLDRAYTVPAIHAWLERCGLTFGRWTEQAPYLPQCGWVAKTPHAGRLRSLPAVRQHAAIELLRGTMTTHSFIACRDDRTGAPQPITFAGDRWRSYIPIALPWTVCVRERLPAGCVAVLINRAHTFTDLLCTVDSFEDRLLGAIDGKRTLGEILSCVGDDADTESRAVSFFERLWDYDQVVFDAS
jgi:SAM-dependent methyltransferase